LLQVSQQYDALAATDVRPLEHNPKDADINRSNRSISDEVHQLHSLF